MDETIVRLVGQGWTSVGRTYVRGAGFIDGAFFDSTMLADKVDTLRSDKEFKSFLKRLNGFYAIVTTGDFCAFAVDHIQSIPLYYTRTPDMRVSDDAHHLSTQLDTNFDEFSELEYLLTGYVTGAGTVFSGLYQLPPGRMAIVREGKIEIQQWFAYTTTKHSLKERKPLDDLDRVLERAIGRLTKYTDGRQLVLSLSSGNDSRVILEHLRRLEYDNILAFTYEDEIKAVEQNVDLNGIDWFPLEHSVEDYREWYQSKDRVKFDRAAGYLDRVPRIHMALPVNELHEKGYIDDDAVFVTGDAVQTTGEHIPDEFISRSDISIDEIIDELLKRHYRMWECPDQLNSDIRARARHAIESLRTVTESLTTHEAISAVEEWDWQERQSKYMLQNYYAERLGYDWWFPLWDREYVTFWSSLSPSQRLNKSFYKSYINQTLDIETSETTLDRFLQQAETIVKGVPLLGPIARWIYYGQLNSVEYGDHPGHGMVTKDQFNELQAGNQGIHTFRALHVMGRIETYPPRNHYPPIDGTIYPRSHY